MSFNYEEDESMDKKGISPIARLEVFKRDGLTCRISGRKTQVVELVIMEVLK